VNNIAPSYSGVFTAMSNNNISADASTTGGAADQSGVTMRFVNPSAGDFALTAAFVEAIGMGVDLSSNAPLSFYDDVSGDPRAVPWSIGAFE
jgi:hypothetical protein